VAAAVSVALVLERQGKWTEAEALFREAIDLDPKNADAHTSLGVVREQQGKLAEAEGLFRKAIHLDPKNALARKRLPRTQRMVALEAKLPAFLKGEVRPQSNDERLALADLCRSKRRYHAAARFYADAFAAEPKRADDLKTGHRYDAACYAALAAAGKGEDAATLDNMEKARLRSQALAWLQADLALWTRRVQDGKPADRAEVQGTMRHWQTDADFAGVRDKEALATLPEAERQTWSKLWTEVAALLAQSGSK
jgi:tetratricopeptide (TPR) repeat protein